MHFATFICDFLVKPTSGTGLLGSRTLNTFASTTQALFRESFKKLGQQRLYWRRRGEYVQRRVCFVNVQSSLHSNVVFSLCARMGNAACIICIMWNSFSVCGHMDNAAYIIFIMWNSISGLDACYHFWFNISCGVAVTVIIHQKKYQVTF